MTATGAWSWVGRRAHAWVALASVDLAVGWSRAEGSVARGARLAAASLGGTLALGLAAAALASGVASLSTSSSRRGRGAALAAGACFGAFAGVALFTGTGLRRAGLALPLVAASTLAGLALPSASRALSRRSPRALRVALAVSAAALLVAHVTVLVRQYPLAHALMAALAAAAFTHAAASRGVRSGVARFVTAAVTVAVLAGAWVSARSPLVRATAAQSLPLGQYLARGVGAVAALGESRQSRALTAAGWGRGPHLSLTGRDIVLVTVDALRADRLAAMGGRGRTPTLDALARRGMSFRRAYATTPHTSYSLASIMLGTHARAVLALSRQGPPRRTLADFLTERGYATAGFLPPAVFSVDAEHFGALADTRFGFAHRVEDWSSAADRVDEALRWVRARRAGERVFLWVHLFEPHEPYDAHPEFPFGARPVDRYDAECAAVDRAVARLRDGLARAGRDPVYLVTADHGEEFGEHGGAYHGTSLYDEQVRVPLLVVGPGVAARVVDDPVSLTDVAPTVLAGLGLSRPPRVRGTDLAPIAAGAVEPEPVFASTGTLRMVAQGRFKLIADTADGTSELYDLRADPRERRNLVEEQPETANRLRRLVAAWEAGHALVDREGEADAGALVPPALARAEQGDRSAAPEVVTLLREGSRDLRPRCARALGDLGDDGPAVRDALARALDDDVVAVRKEAALSLGLLHDARGVALARAALHDDAPTARWRAALSLVRARDAAGVEPLIEGVRALRPGDSQRADGVAALRALDPDVAVDLWFDLVSDPWLGPEAVAALGARRDASLLPRLRASLSSARYPVIARAILGVMAELRDPGVVDAALDAAGRDDPLPELFTLLDQIGRPARRIEALPARVVLTPNRPRSVRWSGPLATRGPRRLYLAVAVSGESEGTLRVGAQGVAVRPGAQVVVIDASEPFARASAVSSDVPAVLVRAVAARPSR